MEKASDAGSFLLMLGDLGDTVGAALLLGLRRESTSMLAKHYDLIVVEDLNVKGMVKNNSLVKHIFDASWGEFTRQLEYRTQWFGSTLVKAGRFYPSSKTCSRCGAVKD